MDKILLFGGGGHSKACIDVIESSGEFIKASPSEKIYSKITNFNFSAELTKNFYDLE